MKLHWKKILWDEPIAEATINNNINNKNSVVNMTIQNDEAIITVQANVVYGSSSSSSFFFTKPADFYSVIQ